MNPFLLGGIAVACAAIGLFFLDYWRSSRDRFLAWRKAAGLSPETSPTFMVIRSERCPDNPDS